MEQFTTDEQLAALDWMFTFDDPRRIKEILSEPDQIVTKINSLVSELGQRAERPAIAANDVVSEKMKLLSKCIDDNAALLNGNEVFLFLGGSLLYGDPSDTPDYDVVGFSFKYGKEKSRACSEFSAALEAMDPHTEDPDIGIVDVNYVDLERFIAFATRLKAGDYNKTDGFERSRLNYLNHVLTGRTVFVPSQYAEDAPQNLRDRLINEFYAQVPVLGALCIMDLEGVLRVRDSRAADDSTLS
ncbi:MAG: hypothetical protein M3Q44_05470 [bacterium]|nr:hypothetical protein [bacterium]